MNPIIEVDRLTKVYRYHEKRPGLGGSFLSLVLRCPSLQQRQ